MDLAFFKRNPVVLADHRANQVIGRAASVQRTAINIKGRETPAVEGSIVFDERSPLGAEIGRQHRDGFRRTVSIGWIPGEAIARSSLKPDDPQYAEAKVKKSRWGDYPVESYLLRKCCLLEVSSVALPADPHAMQRSIWEARREIQAVSQSSGSPDLAATVRSALTDPATWTDPAIVDALAATLAAMVQGTRSSAADFRRAIRAVVASDRTADRTDRPLDPAVAAATQAIRDYRRFTGSK
jgi:hypothetical protein